MAMTRAKASQVTVKSDATGGVVRNLHDKLSETVSVKDFGAVGDGVTDDTAAIQAALYSNGTGNEVHPNKPDTVVYFPAGQYLITDTIHQPAFTKVYGNSPISLASPQDGGTVILARLSDITKSAWVISGFARNNLHGLTDNDVIDPYVYGSSDTDYVNGNFTRARRCSLTGLNFVTDNYTHAGVSFMGSSDIDIKISTHGFLYGICGYTSWTASVEAYGQSYYGGLFFYSPNGLKVTGYVNSYSDVSGAPSDVENTRPQGWSSYESVGYTGADRYFRTGAYFIYTNSVTLTGLTLEAWERAKFFQNCEGVSDISSYNENISEVVWQSIGSTVNVSAPQTFSCPYLTRTSSGGALQIDNLGTGHVVSGVNQTTYDAQARVLVTYVSQGYIHDDEPFNEAVKFNFIRKDPIVIYVDGTSGSNTNTGLTATNSVQDLQTAISRAYYYGGTEIRLVEGTSVQLTSDTALLSDLVIVGEGAGATLTHYSSGGYVRGLYLDSYNIQFKNLTIVTQAASTSSSRGALKPRGASKITYKDCIFDLDPTTALLNPAYNDSGSLVLSIYDCSGSIEYFGLNPYANGSQVKTLFSNYNNSFTGSQAWGSNFTVY